MKKRFIVALITLLLLLVSALAIVKPPPSHYPMLTVAVPPDALIAADAEGLVLTFLFHSRPTLPSCEAFTGNIARTVLEKCGQCAIKSLNCPTQLNTEERKFLSDAPLSVPSGRMDTGVIVFNGEAVSSLASCRATESQSAGKHAVRCFPADTPRPLPPKKTPSLSEAAYAFLGLLIAASASWLICWLIVRYEHLHAHFSHDHTDAGPQKFHALPTPRIGGLALTGGLLAAGGLMLLVPELTSEREFSLILLASAPAFLGGMIEDITKKVGVSERLLLTMLSGAVGAWLLGATLNRLDIPGIDHALLWTPFAVALTIFAIGGVANAINIIDGYNGLAAGYAAIILTGMAWVAAQTGDMLIFPIALAMTGALLGFLKWNWPGGKIFLGDGGAYLLGFILAELAVLLVIRNPEVSPWLPLLLLIHPIFETVFSIYRRKFRRGQTPGKPDALHLHQLVYSRLVRHHVGTRVAELKTARNAKVAPYFWGAGIILALIGSLCWRSSPLLMLASLGYCIFYVVGYRRIAHWRMGK